MYFKHFVAFGMFRAVSIFIENRYASKCLPIHFMISQGAYENDIQRGIALLLDQGRHTH